MIGAWKYHKNITQLSQDFDYSYITAFQVIECWKKFGTPSSKSQHQISNNSKRLTSEDMPKLIKIVENNHFTTLLQLREQLVVAGLPKIYINTLCKYLDILKFHSHIAVYKSVLLAKNIQNHLNFAHPKLDWPLEMWQELVWSDESSFKLFESNSRIRVLWRLDEKYIKDHLFTLMDILTELSILRF
ncbi:hypothetical protein BC936DRAFT_137501 [Jimgerdemannia flammicorona]|uniref:Uncharacterized protein n=1 Tax=Jimgerdemannia flammicorona TaxID=994334 RepID=A0A433CX78_9FUNG|nr:hypothetical protein BC936DRAFT_137501 [Jimgerdemannia flammicorona]